MNEKMELRTSKLHGKHYVWVSFEGKDVYVSQHFTSRKYAEKAKEKNYIIWKKNPQDKCVFCGHV